MVTAHGLHWFDVRKTTFKDMKIGKYYLTNVKTSEYRKSKKNQPHLKLKTLIRPDELNIIIESVHQHIVDKNIPYDNYNAFKIFASVLEKEYPSEFMILSDGFTKQTNGMRHYFERNTVYHNLFVTVDTSINLQEKAFYVFDVKCVGHRLKGLKFRQLDLCKKQFRRDFPTEWEQVRAQCGGAMCSSKKTDVWVQKQYCLYKKQKDKIAVAQLSERKKQKLLRKQELNISLVEAIAEEKKQKTMKSINEAIMADGSDEQFLSLAIAEYEKTCNCSSYIYIFSNGIAHKMACENKMLNYLHGIEKIKYGDDRIFRIWIFDKNDDTQRAFQSLDLFRGKLRARNAIFQHRTFDVNDSSEPAKCINNALLYVPVDTSKCINITDYDKAFVMCNNIGAFNNLHHVGIDDQGEKVWFFVKCEQIDKAIGNLDSNDLNFSENENN